MTHSGLWVFGEGVYVPVEQITYITTATQQGPPRVIIGTGGYASTAGTDEAAGEVTVAEALREHRMRDLNEVRDAAKVLILKISDLLSSGTRGMLRYSSPALDDAEDAGDWVLVQITDLVGYKKL